MLKLLVSFQGTPVKDKAAFPYSKIAAHLDWGLQLNAEALRSTQPSSYPTQPPVHPWSAGLDEILA